MTAPFTPASTSSVTVGAPARGWARLLAGVMLGLSVPWVAQLRLVVPIEQTILFIGPTIAVCGLIAWLFGGRFLLFGAWGVLAFWMMAMPSPAAAAFEPLSRGWVLLLSASFGFVSWLSPRQFFFPRALTATAITFGVALLLMVGRRGGTNDVRRTVEEESARRLQQVSQEYDLRSRSEEWQSFVARFPGAAAVVEQGELQLPTIARGATTLFPSLLGLQSLAMLALAWAVFHRSSRTRIGPPLRTLAEFRFGDSLIWGVVVGVTLLVLPGFSEARGLGMNLLAFFGALYALRGLGVLSWFLAPGRPTPVLLVIAACLAGPVVAVFSLGLGLADTWIDWRGRLRPSS